jgi:hypothetical protein
MFEAPLAIATLLEGVVAPWWIGGGWAIDLFLGRVTRAHQDVDVVILRRDQERFRRHLGPGWALVYVQRPGGGRVPWTAGQRLASPIHEIHATAPATGETLELLLNEADGSTWHYRRDARITLPLDRLGATSRAVIPALAPEVALLYKSKDPRPTDLADLRVALPALDHAAILWLDGAVGQAHPLSPYLPILRQYADPGGAM